MPLTQRRYRDDDSVKAQEAGLNRSTTHVDFMIGSEEMNIDGIKEDGSAYQSSAMVHGLKF